MSFRVCLRSALLCLGLICATATTVLAGLDVTVWEDLPKGWRWGPLDGEPADRFASPLLAFSRLPAKYNPRGIEVDRSSPFALRAEARFRVPSGNTRLILRSRNAARLSVDGVVVAETKPVNPNSAGHEDVPVVIHPEDPRWRHVAVGDQERIVTWESDGQEHVVLLLALIGDRKLRHETGELSVSVAIPGAVPFVLGGDGRVTLTDSGWSDFEAAESTSLDAFDASRRNLAAQSEAPYWQLRHEAARRKAEEGAELAPPGEGHPVDRRIAAGSKGDARPIAAGIDDAAFFRRLSLDTIGLIPKASEVEAFLADPRPDKRDRAIDARLADPRWADGWMGYWQDVLAENPGILKPTLNNTGPFRRYLHQAFADNTPADRLATEVIRMEGSLLGGGPAGFGMASQNDAPLATKAQVLAKAFLAAEMKCARCHDAPGHPFDQADLFGLAGLLAGKDVAVPLASTVKPQPGGRSPAVSVTLKAGEVVAPHWALADIGEGSPEAGLLPPGANSRDRLALMITGPANRRFAPVLANRLWKRYLGIGLVEPVDDWDERPTTIHAALLDDLARDLMAHDYDLKHLARLILTSKTYQAQVDPTGLPARRRMSAEQVLDSVFAAVGKPFGAEELNLDPDGRRPPTEFLNLGIPKRAWQFTSLSNERDRPALSLPVAQGLVDVLETFGWRASRQDAITDRDEATTPLQPAMLANGVAINHAARLTEDAAITRLCLADQPPQRLIHNVYLRIVSRPPTEAETARAVALLGESYAGRVVPNAKPAPASVGRPPRRVSWSNHLSPEATRIQLEEEKAARAGDPPTCRLTSEFRERMEDLVWALLNSPEFVFVP